MGIDGPKSSRGLLMGGKIHGCNRFPRHRKGFRQHKVKRVGVDDLHIKMSKLLRIAHEKIAKLQAEIKRWVAAMSGMSPRESTDLYADPN